MLKEIKRHNPDVPIIRLAEIYYTLAECEMRAGNKTEAAEWINKVRRRYFENGMIPIRSLQIIWINTVCWMNG